MAEEAKKVTDMYSEDRTTKEFVDYITALVEGRKKELEALIRRVEKEDKFLK